MASLTPTGLETITYGQQGWNAIVTANMQKLNGWIGKLLPLVNASNRTSGEVPVWDTSSSSWKPSSVITDQGEAIVALRAELAALRARVAALETV